MKYIIGKRLKTARKKRGVSQKELAEKIGIHINNISRYENGETEMSFVKALCISSALNVPLDWLAGKTDKDPFGNTY